MKKIKYLIFLTIIIFASPSVMANNLKSINIEMDIDKNGNAKVKEIWNMYIDEGTEIYKPLGNLGNSVISNYKVYLDNHEFTYLENWNINATFNEKAYKNGISNDNELCFGISKKGNNTYIMTYDISNVIFNVDDAQILYYKFINDSMTPVPKYINIKIKSYYNFPDNLDVWGYGYKGYAYVKDGIIELTNENDFDSSMYAVALVKFPASTFNTINTINNYNSFNDVYNKASSGTFNYDYKDNSWIFKYLIQIIIFLIAVISVIIKTKTNIYQKYQREKIKIKNINNFRDIPCNKDIFMAYFLSNTYNLNKQKVDFLGALILKWIKTDQIKVINTSKDGKPKDKNNTSFDFSKDIITDNILEKEMYDMIREASQDDILESKELQKWCRTNYSKYLNWFDKVLSDTKNKYKNNGLIKKDPLIKNNKKLVCNEYLHEEAVHLAGLKKFLVEFSRIDDKSIMEVKLWDEYLMFAQIFGIADKVAKQFKKLYPELTNDFDERGYNLDTIIYLNYITSRSNSAASTARDNANNYNAGGGGFSIGGGGGGSFGGGSGGGIR